MHDIWVSSWDDAVSRPNAQALDANVYTVVPPDSDATGPPANASGLYAPTALGLPLSRALAKAANGWLGLEDSSVAFNVKVVGGVPATGRVHAYSPAAVVGAPGPGVLWYWAVLHVDAASAK